MRWLDLYTNTWVLLLISGLGVIIFTILISKASKYWQASWNKNISRIYFVLTFFFALFGAFLIEIDRKQASNIDGYIFTILLFLLLLVPPLLIYYFLIWIISEGKERKLKEEWDRRSHDEEEKKLLEILKKNK
jgi:cytochrome bd-type quinol oxidase subunit 2